MHSARTILSLLTVASIGLLLAPASQAEAVAAPTVTMTAEDDCSSGGALILRFGGTVSVPGAPAGANYYLEIPQVNQDYDAQIGTSYPAGAVVVSDGSSYGIGVPFNPLPYSVGTTFQWDLRVGSDASGQIVATGTSTPLSGPGVCSSYPPVTGHPAPVNDDQAQTQGCAQVLFVGLRGSGETASWGKVVDPVAQSLNRTLPKSISLRRVYVDYRAASVPSIVAKGFNQYFDSVTDGELRLENVLLDSQSRCPNEKWIIAGYSQGALAANLLMRSLGDSSQLAELNFVADPARTALRSGINVGSARPAAGIYADTFDTTPLSAALSGKTLSLCNNHDTVCDYGTFFHNPGNPAYVANFILGVRIHTSYPMSSYDQLTLLGILDASRARHAISVG